MMDANLFRQAQTAMRELCAESALRPGDIVVVGCSTSEVLGHRIGTAGTSDVASVLLDAFLPLLEEQNIYLAVQCCEHLNRALVVPRACLEAHHLEECSVVPHPRAGGSLAAAYFARLGQPAVALSLRAGAGLDIGDTLIGMHLRAVAVPLRLSLSALGDAHLTAAKTRPPYIGGPRAIYEPV